MTTLEQNNPDTIAREAPAAAEPLPPGPGARLREARERLGLSVDDVVSRIKFAPRQIAALEADDYAQLPEPAFVRGFVRSYARLVQLDPAPLLAALPHTPAAPAPAAEQALPEVPFPTEYSTRKPNLIWLGAALAVAIVLGLFALLQRGGSKAPAANAPAAVANPPAAASEAKVETLPLPAVEVLPDSAVLPVAPSGVSVTPAAGPVSPPTTPATPTPPAPSQPKTTSDLPLTSLRVAPSVSATAAPATRIEQGTVAKPAAALRLTFDGDSWVDVTDKNGKVLLSQLNPRGSEQNIEGAPPFSLVIGRAAVVHLYYKGKPVDLAPYTKVTTARLTLE